MRLKNALLAKVFFLTLLTISANAVAAVTLSTDVQSGLAPLAVRVTWTSTNAVSCTASGVWSGAKALSGAETITVNASGRVTLTCTEAAIPGSAVLTWVAPTQNTDGSALTNLASYRIYYGTSPTALSATRDVTVGNLSHTLTPLADGTWYFSMTATNSAGTESLRTNIANKVVTATTGAITSDFDDITIIPRPNPPSDLRVADVNAYDIKLQESPRLAIVINRRVGTAKLGAACNEAKCLADSYCGVYQRTQVKLSRSPISSTIVAKCS